MMDTLNYDEMSMERDCPENLSIGLETLIKILDEEPAPPIPDLLGTSAGSHMEQLDCQRDCEPLHPQHESRPSELGNLNSLDDSEHNEPWFEPSAEHKGFSNHYGIFYGDPLHNTHLVESNDLCSSPSVHSSNWLRLSSTDLDISVIDSCGDSFGSFVTDDVNINKPQNNSPNCGFSQGCTDEFGLFYKRQFNFTGDADLVGLKDNLENQNFEAPLQHSSRKSNTDLDNISSPCLLQMGERSLAHIMLTEECGSINKRHSDLNGDAILGSPVQSENTHTNFVACKSEDLALPPQYKISPDINSTERIKDSYDANNSSLTATGDFLVSSVAGLEPCLSVKVRDLPHDEMAQFHGKNGEGTRLCLFKDSVKCTVQSGSTVDMDLALPQQYKISPDINSTERIKDAHDANNSSLSISEDFLVSADAASRPSLPAKVMGIPHYNVTQFPENNGGGTRLFLSKDSVNCTVQEQSTHSSVLEDSVDMDALLTCSLYAQQYRCEDTGMMSESSTDSSPLPYNHKPMLLNLNGSANNLTQLISDHKMILQRKEQKDLINEKKRPQISTTHQQQHQHSKIAKIAIESKPSRRNSTLDDDTDLFILDDFNDSILPTPPPALVNPHHHAGPGTLRTRSDDERLTFRLALQVIR